MKKTLLSRAVILGSLGTVALTAMPMVSVAETEEQAVVEEVMVTGSRIQRSTYTSPTPVTVLNADQINAAGATNVAEFLKQIPQAFAETNTSTSNFSSTTAGLNTTSLRNLGAERTLVLVNGRRFVSGTNPGTGYAVDLNSIPTALVERIEILTGGQSAVYGSDAIAGVVNIITRKDIDGVEISVRKGSSFEGGADTTDVELTIGSVFERGNAYVSFGISREGGLEATDRDFSDTDLAAADTNDDGIADSWQPLLSSYPPAGRVTVQDADGNRTNFSGDGSEYGGGFNRAEYRYLTQPLDRKFAAAGLNFQVSDTVKAYAELNYSLVENESNMEPHPFDINADIFGTDVGSGANGIPLDSPIVPQSLRDSILSIDPTVEYITDLGNNAVVRRLAETGARGSEVNRSTIRAVSGLEVQLDNGWVWDSYFNWGQTTQTQSEKGGLNVGRAYQALDVVTDPDTGEIMCRSAAARASGCVPFTPFGEGTITAEQADYLAAPGNFYSEVKQEIYSTSLAGDLPIEMNGYPIAFAVGAEYRKESGQEAVSGFNQVGQGTANRIAPTDGEYDVMDYFAEVSIPVLPGSALELAARVGDYSTVGTQTTWKVGFDAELPADLRFRTVYASAVRAPNVSDLYAGKGETFLTVVDPCDGLGSAEESQSDLVKQNCLADPTVAARIDREGEFVLTQAEAQGTGGFIGGNEDVQEEKSTSFTAGLVWAPIDIDGLNIALDYYDIEVDDAIDQTSRTLVLERCYNKDASSFTADCNGAVYRDPDTGALLQANSGTSNENILRVSGMDIEASYRAQVGPGIMNASVVWNHLLKDEVEGILSGEVRDDRGEVANPENKAIFGVNYLYGDLMVDWRMRYWGEVVDSNDPDVENAAWLGGNMDGSSLNEIDAVMYHDFRVGYDWKGDYNFHVGVKNAFDEEPPILGQGTLSSQENTGMNTDARAYDVVGRAWYAGVKARF
ncbi:TonB-dependent receptor [Bacterioplanes sanyensis]|uniref:TonB-dependent receptor n=1 Tax=Bacterioplanes sanyensis TaxID=1249553 RepID=A0A222FNY5_9GAMM|nr:TonB-dependent receptor [Bacterioplanes sanyensis]ASP40224.1 TonB-dependent receptor [Bacterioplanes sanyensis]